MKRRIRIVIARLGLDAHWRGSAVVARALRDAGMEVVFLGNQRPEAIVRAALEEGADFVGLSTLSGNHMDLAPEVLRGMREAGMADVPVILGGAVPPGDAARLKEIGVAEVFGPGSSLKDIVSRFSRRERRKRSRTVRGEPAGDRKRERVRRGA